MTETDKLRFWYRPAKSWPSSNFAMNLMDSGSRKPVEGNFPSMIEKVEAMTEDKGATSGLSGEN
jgi:hypothetical protein